MLLRPLPSLRLLSGAGVAALCLSALGFSLSAHAAFFEDADARRAILELREQVQALKKSLDEYKLKDLEELRRQNQTAILNLSSQLDQLRDANAALLGNNEKLSHEVALLQKRLTVLSQLTDERLRRVEPKQVTFNGKEVSVLPAEQSEYESALALISSGDFARAKSAFETFRKNRPKSPYAASALYWLGNAYYGLADCGKSIEAFRAMLALEPKHSDAPNALLSIVNCQIESHDNNAAQATIDKMAEQFPDEAATRSARERLSQAQQQSLPPATPPADPARATNTDARISNTDARISGTENRSPSADESTKVPATMPRTVSTPVVTAPADGTKAKPTKPSAKPKPTAKADKKGSSSKSQKTNSHKKSNED